VSVLEAASALRQLLLQLLLHGVSAVVGATARMCSLLAQHNTSKRLRSFPSLTIIVIWHSDHKLSERIR
jgi:hypothetical protein